MGRSHLAPLFHRNARSSCCNSDPRPSRHQLLRRLQPIRHRWTPRSRALPTPWPLRPILSRHPGSQHHRKQLPQYLQRDLQSASAGSLDAGRTAFHLDVHRHRHILRYCYPRLQPLRAGARGFHALDRKPSTLHFPAPAFSSVLYRNHTTNTSRNRATGSPSTKASP